VTIKCPEELWNVNRRVEGVFGGQNFDGVEDDLRKLNVRNWWTVAKDRESWKILRETEAHKGL
jgi:hypothetical protein